MKKIVLILSLVIILIAASTFFLMREDSPSQTASAQSEDDTKKHEKVIEIAIEKNINGEITSGEIMMTFEDPPTLPSYRETTLGVFLDQNGDILSLGTGSITVEVSVEVVNDEDPEETINVSYSGEPVDVKVTADTVIYKDITEVPEVTQEDLESGNKVVLREIEPGSLDELEESMILRVWGSEIDGLVTADVLVFEEIH